MEEFPFPVDIEQLATQAIQFVPRFITALGIIALFWLIFRIGRGWTKAALGRAGFDETLVGLLVDNVLKYVVMAFAFVMAADQVGVNVTAALAGISVAGIAIGFAAQDTLANVIAGFLIFFDKPFEVGDWVTVAGENGQIREITLRTTRIRTRNNTYVVIPNKRIIDEVLVNHSKHGATRVDCPLGIAYKEFIPEARRVLLEAAGGLEGVLADPPPAVIVDQLGASSVDLEVRVWVEDARLEESIRYDVTEAGKLALDAAGIQIPFPHLQLFVDDVEERVWTSAEQRIRPSASL